MDTSIDIDFGICLDGFEPPDPLAEGLEAIGIDINPCDDFSIDIFPLRGDIEFHVTVGFIFAFETGGTVHAWDYLNLGECEGYCTDDKPYCYVEKGKSWFTGLDLIIDLFFWKIRVSMIPPMTPECPGIMNPPSPTPRHLPAPGQELSAYYANWNIWTVNKSKFQPLPNTEVSKIDSINYAFATVSYYYDPANSNTWGFFADFTDNLCSDSSGQKWLALAPWIGYAGGQQCPVLNCTNSQGGNAAGRASPCRTLLDVSQLPLVNGQRSFCGQMMYVLHDLKAVNPKLKALLSIGGWYDSAYFAYATSPGQGMNSFLDSVNNFIAYFGWDGVDIDYEYPGWIHGAQVPPPIPDRSQLWLNDAQLNWTKTHKPDDLMHTQADLTNQYANFLSALRARMPTRQISVAAPAGLDKIIGSQGSDYAKAVCSVDGVIVNLMTYDMHGAFDNPGGMTAHQAPVRNMTWYQARGAGYNISTAVAHYKKNCGSHSVRLGIPFYGRVYTGVAAGSTCGLGQNFTGGLVDAAGAAVLPSYDDIMNPGNGYAVYHDPTNYYAAYALGPSGNFVSFEDKVSLASKLNYTIGKTGMAGAFYWLSGNDGHADLVETVYYALQNKSSPVMNGTFCSGPVNVTTSSSYSSSSSSSSIIPLTSSSTTTTTTSSSSTTMSIRSSTSATPSSSPSVVAQWGKCGGNGYTGPTQCAPPATCVYQTECECQSPERRLRRFASC
ncbi:glycoside hydrolase family 18 protein [Apiospora hydei]|uniref:chitinase n=1 Tax=Apiospora hydei TaxID=1337664 RepID=A0ABR1WCB3_9PEZI